MYLYCLFTWYVTLFRCSHQFERVGKKTSIGGNDGSQSNRKVFKCMFTLIFWSYHSVRFKIVQAQVLILTSVVRCLILTLNFGLDHDHHIHCAVLCFLYCNLWIKVSKFKCKQNSKHKRGRFEIMRWPFWFDVVDPLQFTHYEVWGVYGRANESWAAKQNKIVLVQKCLHLISIVDFRIYVAVVVW